MKYKLKEKISKSMLKAGTNEAHKSLNETEGCWWFIHKPAKPAALLRLKKTK